MQFSHLGTKMYWLLNIEYLEVIQFLETLFCFYKFKNYLVLLLFEKKKRVKH